MVEESRQAQVMGFARKLRAMRTQANLVEVALALEDFRMEMVRADRERIKEAVKVWSSASENREQLESWGRVSWQNVEQTLMGSVVPGIIDKAATH